MRDDNPDLIDGTRWVRAVDVDKITWVDYTSFGSTVEVLRCFYIDTAHASAAGKRLPWRFPGWITHSEDWVQQMCTANKCLQYSGRARLVQFEGCK